MPADLPLSIVISQVLTHTPVWVWAILIAITVVGLRQLPDHTLTTRRLTVVPVLLAAYSLWGALAAFGGHASVAAAWVAGVALTVGASHLAPDAFKSTHEGGGRHAIKGSAWPLLIMWSVFGVRYVSTVTLIMHPGLAHGTLFSEVMPAVYGALAGVFVARSVRILLRARQPALLRLA